MAIKLLNGSDELLISVIAATGCLSISDQFLQNLVEKANGRMLFVQFQISQVAASGEVGSATILPALQLRNDVGVGDTAVDIDQLSSIQRLHHHDLQSRR